MAQLYQGRGEAVQNYKLETLFQKQQMNNFVETRQAPQVQGKIIQWVQGKKIGHGTTGEVFEAQNVDSAEMFVVKKYHLVHQFNGVDKEKMKALK